MADHWDWTPDDTGLDDDDTPCAFCGEEGCERSCTGAILEDLEDLLEEEEP